MLIHSSIHSARETELTELVSQLQQRPCTVTYLGGEGNQKELPSNKQWPTFQTSLGRLSLSLFEKDEPAPYLMIVKKIVSLDERALSSMSSRFVGFEFPQGEIHRYMVTYGDGRCERANLLVYSESDQVEVCNKQKQARRSPAFLRVPFSLRLFLSTKSLAHGEKIPVCSGEISSREMSLKKKVYVYFHKGEIEMTIDENESGLLQKNAARVQVEFVLQDFEMKLEDALTLRPRDAIQIDCPGELHGIIRIGGGDWLQGRLTYSEGYVTLNIDKFAKEETFEEGTR